MRSWKAALGQVGDPLRLRGLKVLGTVAILAPTLLLLAYAVISYVGSFRAAEARALHLSSILQDHAQRLFEAVDLALRNADQRLGDLSDESIRSDVRLWQDIRRIQGAAPQIGSGCQQQGAVRRLNKNRANLRCRALDSAYVLP